MNLRKIDRLVAEKVMGWRLKSFPGEGGGFSAWLNDDGKIIKYENNCTLHAQPYDFWKPTTNIADAWQVVKEFYEKGDKVTVTNTLGGNWCCYISTGLGQFSAIAETAPLAICLAALKACDIEVETE